MFNEHPEFVVGVATRRCGDTRQIFTKKFHKHLLPEAWVSNGRVSNLYLTKFSRFNDLGWFGNYRPSSDSLRNASNRFSEPPHVSPTSKSLGYFSTPSLMEFIKLEHPYRHLLRGFDPCSWPKTHAPNP